MNQLLLSVLLIGALPAPYNELGLDEKEVKQVETIQFRYLKLEQQITAADKARFKAIQNLHNRRDAEIDKLLTIDQKNETNRNTQADAGGNPHRRRIFSQLQNRRLRRTITLKRRTSNEPH